MDLFDCFGVEDFHYNNKRCHLCSKDKGKSRCEAILMTHKFKVFMKISVFKSSAKYLWMFHRPPALHESTSHSEEQICTVNINSLILFQYVMSPAESRSPFVIFQVCPSGCSLWSAGKNPTQSQCGHLWFISFSTRWRCDSRVCCVHKREEEEIYEKVCVFIWWITADTVSLHDCCWKPLFLRPHLIVLIFKTKKIFCFCLPYLSVWLVDLLLMNI